MHARKYREGKAAMINDTISKAMDAAESLEKEAALILTALNVGGTAAMRARLIDCIVNAAVMRVTASFDAAFRMMK
jgi:hypothetical protein